MKKLLVLLAAVCAVSVLAESIVLKTIDFETSEGYQPGDLLNQNGWYGIYSGADRQIVVNDSTAAPSGAQYVTTADGKSCNSAVRFDISAGYQPNNKLRISWSACALEGGDTFYVKIHNLGESMNGSNPRTFDTEIAEITISQSGWCNCSVCKEDKTGTTDIKKLLAAPFVFHDFSLTIDPKDHTIKEYTIDDEVVFDGSAVYYYKNDRSSGYAGGSDIVDGVRIMNKGSFDNFKVEMVPEPAAFALIALLGLFFARKQR